MAGSGRASADTAIAIALAAGSTVEEAATAAGVSPRTVARRLRDGAFRGRLADLRVRALSQAAGRLASASVAAVRELEALIDDPDPRIRLRAARGVLHDAGRMAEAVDLAERVAILEARLAPPKVHPGLRAVGP